METKKCSKCGIEKCITDFYKKKDGKDGLRGQCKPCFLIGKADYRKSTEYRVWAEEYSNNPQTKERLKSWYKSPKRKEWKKKYRQTPVCKFHDYSARSKKKGYNFNLTKKEFEKLITGTCHYCGVRDNMGIDRVDSNKGYIIDNCVPCCWKCNRMKHSSTENDFIKQVEKIYNYYKGRL